MNRVIFLLKEEVRQVPTVLGAAAVSGVFGFSAAHIWEVDSRAKVWFYSAMCGAIGGGVGAAVYCPIMFSTAALLNSVWRHSSLA